MDINFLNKKEEELPTPKQDPKTEAKLRIDLKDLDQKHDKLAKPSKKDSPKKNHKMHKAEKKTGSSVDGVDLIPKNMRSVSGEQKSSLMVAFVIIAIVTVGIGLGIAFVLNQYLTQSKNELAQLDTELAAIQKEQADLAGAKKEADIFNSRVEIVKGFLDNHVYWTQFFDRLEDLTLPNVYYSNVVADVASVKLSVVAPDFQTAAKQLYYLQSADDLVRDSVLAALQIKDQEIRREGEAPIARRAVLYDVTLYLHPEIFLKSSLNE